MNFREGWRGYLWQGRFASCPMDETHTLVAARYIELNPVRAGLVALAEDWPWSSAGTHLHGKPDGLTEPDALGIPPAQWVNFLAAGLDDAALEAIRRGERTGRPLGDAAFVAHLEAETGRRLAPAKPGRKPQAPSCEDKMDILV